MEEAEVRDINWSVQFEITINGVSKKFWELDEVERQIILDGIKDDYYSGTFCH